MFLPYLATLFQLIFRITHNLLDNRGKGSKNVNKNVVRFPSALAVTADDFFIIISFFFSSKVMRQTEKVHFVLDGTYKPPELFGAYPITIIFLVMG